MGVSKLLFGTSHSTVVEEDQNTEVLQVDWSKEEEAKVKRKSVTIEYRRADIALFYLC